jgi:hypothetical protein
VLLTCNTSEKAVVYSTAEGDSRSESNMLCVWQRLIHVCNLDSNKTYQYVILESLGTMNTKVECWF